MIQRCNAFYIFSCLAVLKSSVEIHIVDSQSLFRPHQLKSGPQGELTRNRPYRDLGTIYEVYM